MKNFLYATAFALGLMACNENNFPQATDTKNLTEEAQVREAYENAKAKILAKPDSPERTRELEALSYAFERDLLRAYEAKLRKQRKANQASLLQTLPNEPGN